MTTQQQDSPFLGALEVARRRRVLAISVFAVALAAAASFALFLPDLYRGTAVVLIDRPVSQVQPVGVLPGGNQRVLVQGHRRPPEVGANLGPQAPFPRRPHHCPDLGAERTVAHRGEPMPLQHPLGIGAEGGEFRWHQGASQR